MIRKLGVFCTVIVIALMFAGCPGGGLVGNWVLTSAPASFGLQLMGNGNVTAYAAPDTLPGTLTWELNGTEFILRQEVGNSHTIWIGRVTGGNAMSGSFVIWDGGGMGIGGNWTATKQ